MLPTLVTRTFSDPGWIYEPKWDGWRALCFIRNGQGQLISRKGNSLNDRFPELRDVAKSIKATKAILDGEIVALDEHGMPCFDRLQFRKGRPCSIVFYAFDLLYLDGFNLTQCPLIARKTALKRILPKRNTGRVRFTDHVTGRGEPLLEKIGALKLEGMMMKRKDSVYAFRRSRDWLKIKTVAGRETMQKPLNCGIGIGPAELMLRK
jgi:bifunctional non-homologous end joining protein LigD